MFVVETLQNAQVFIRKKMDKYSKVHLDYGILGSP